MGIHALAVCRSSGSVLGEDLEAAKGKHTGIQILGSNTFTLGNQGTLRERAESRTGAGKIQVSEEHVLS